MRARYGMDRRSRAPWVVAALTAAVLGFVVWLTVAEQGGRVDATLLSWDAQADHAHVVLDVRRAGGQAVRCAIRAQDRTRVDVGYLALDVPPGPTQLQVEADVATLMPAYVVELLGCAPAGELRVPDSAFPPGVVPPAQPWRAPAS